MTRMAENCVNQASVSLCLHSHKSNIRGSDGHSRMVIYSLLGQKAECCVTVISD